MCIIGLFISFVSVILFVCFNNNIFLWRRFARSVLKILFVFVFPDSFSCSSMFLFTVFIRLVSESFDMCVNTRICPSWGTLLFSSLWGSFLVKFFIISFFVSISVFRKWISFSEFAIILLSTSFWCSSWLYRFIFCLISFCIRSHRSFFIPFNKMSLIFWYLSFLNVLSKTSKVSGNSAASGSVSLDMKESIWSGTVFKLSSRFAFFQLLEYSLLLE